MNGSASQFVMVYPSSCCQIYVLFANTTNITDDRCERELEVIDPLGSLRSRCRQSSRVCPVAQCFCAPRGQCSHVLVICDVHARQMVQEHYEGIQQNNISLADHVIYSALYTRPLAMLHSADIVIMPSSSLVSSGHKR